MCGRYALYGPVSRRRGTVPEEFSPSWWNALADRVDTGAQRFNVAPTDVMPVVASSKNGEIVVRDLRWGLVPYWAKDTRIGAKAINARAETVAVKPMFREAFKRRRCLVPASGYFEWKVEAGGKQPYFIHSPTEPVMMFAGLWESWRENRDERDAEALRTYSIITGPPGVVSGDVHDRAPVIVRARHWEPWLRGETASASEILGSTADIELAFHAVSKAVGSPKNDRPDLVAPAPA